VPDKKVMAHMQAISSIVNGNGSSFLVGDSIYVRGLELSDAKQAMGWRPSPFPISSEQVEEQLKKQVPDAAERREVRLVACRRSDGAAIGSVLVEFSSPPSAYLRMSAAQALGARGDELQAEMLGVILPWLTDERHCPSIHLTSDSDLIAVARRALALGMTEAVRLRQGIWRDGAHHDWLELEYLHPAWVEKLGDPGPGITFAGEPVTSPRAPAPRRDRFDASPLPVNAIIASDRLALRPMEAGDAEQIARWLRNEPTYDFGLGRFPLSEVEIDDWIRKMGEKEPPSAMEFAVVLRESGELIGENGLYAIDWLARTAESGTWLYRPEYRGSGFGTEAKHLLLEYAFDRIGLNMIWSWVKMSNTRSQAALRKQGYRDAGRLNWVNLAPGGFDDAAMFDILAGEWRAARDATGRDQR
jgi:RimJ/RimL family protein N-acetyltransferase